MRAARGRRIINFGMTESVSGLCFRRSARPRTQPMPRGRPKGSRNAFIFILFVHCTPNPYQTNNFTNVTNYTVQYSAVTPKGTQVDGNLDLAEIDRRIDQVEQCLQHITVLPIQAHCLATNFDHQIHRNFLGVKLAPDWHWTDNACDGNPQQVFACGKAPAALCEAKGLTVSEACPCCWRGVVQDNSVIVTTPNMHLFDETLIRIVTGCNYIWDNELVGCYTP